MQDFYIEVIYWPQDRLILSRLGTRAGVVQTARHYDALGVNQTNNDRRDVRQWRASASTGAGASRARVLDLTRICRSRHSQGKDRNGQLAA